MNKCPLAILLIAVPAFAQAQTALPVPPPAPPPIRVLPGPPQIRIPVPVARSISEAYPRNPRIISTGIEGADYPAQAYREGREGATAFELDVSAEGRATGCRISESSGHADLDSLTCNLLLERARFTPAMAQAEQPVAGTYRGSHVWRKRAQDIGPTVMDVTMTIGADGRISACQVNELSGVLAEQAAPRDPCQSMFRGGAPFRDAEGNPVARALHFRVDVALVEPAADENSGQ